MDKKLREKIKEYSYKCVKVSVNIDWLISILQGLKKTGTTHATIEYQQDDVVIINNYIMIANYLKEE